MRIRQARTTRNLSLSEVATRAHISVATLSRIERDKQGLELGLFLTLCRILRSSPQELLGGETSDNVDPPALRIAGMNHDERMELWRELAANRRNIARATTVRSNARKLIDEVEELLAQLEYVRAEMEGVQSRVRRRA